MLEKYLKMRCIACGDGLAERERQLLCELSIQFGLQRAINFDDSQDSCLNKDCEVCGESEAKLVLAMITLSKAILGHTCS